MLRFLILNDLAVNFHLVERRGNKTLLLVLRLYLLNSKSVPSEPGGKDWISMVAQLKPFFFFFLKEARNFSCVTQPQMVSIGNKTPGGKAVRSQSIAWGSVVVPGGSGGLWDTIPSWSV